MIEIVNIKYNATFKLCINPDAIAKKVKQDIRNRYSDIRNIKHLRLMPIPNA